MVTLYYLEIKTHTNFASHLPGLVPISDLSSFHLGMRGSSVWKNTHMQMATRAASTP